MTLEPEHFPLFQNLFIGKQFILNKACHSQSTLGWILIPKNTEITCLSFEEEGFMIGKFTHSGISVIGSIIALNGNLQPIEEPELLFKTVRVKEQSDNNIDNNTDFYVSSLFKQNDQEYAFLLPIDEYGIRDSFSALTLPVSTLTLID